MLRRVLVAVGGVLLAGFLLVQLVPYGRAHDNPPVVAEPQWDSPQTRALFFRACGDCHSNETRWPWYTTIAPISWLAQRDVEEGRAKCNVSEWGTGRQECREAAETVIEGSMPPWYYLPLHPAARLTASERDQLIQGLLATFGGEREREGDETNGAGAAVALTR